MNLENNYEKSPLQKILINKIEGYGGLEKITIYIEDFRKKLNINDNLLLSNLSDYLKFCYRNYMNIEIDILDFKIVYIATLDLLKKSLLTFRNECLKFLLELLEHNLNYVSELKTQLN